MQDAKEVKILIVDDDDINRCGLTTILRNTGYEIKEATKGKEALRKAETENPNLIILAVNLPDITGYEVCEQLKLNPITEFIPILCMSSYYIKNLKIGFTD